MHELWVLVVAGSNPASPTHSLDGIEACMEMSPMSLADFIERDRPRILEAWVAYALTIFGEAPHDGLLLRDHVTDLLDAIVADMRAPQTATERAEKSKGRGVLGPLDKVSELHTQSRGEQGMRLGQIVAEYRALRASVLALWEAQGGDAVGVGRFNEAIDQAIAASVERFTTMAERYQDQSLGILGHDLRNPLSAVIAGATLLATDVLSKPQRHEIAGRVVSSAKRMNRMVADLLDLTRARFGDAIPVERTSTDLTQLCEQVASEHASQHAAGVRFVGRGDLRGEWDSDRISQVVSNLVRNAIEHGSADAPVTITAEGRRDDVVVMVHNSGPVISADALRTIFDARVHGHDRSKQHTGLGLGLYIAWHVVEAHEGDIHAESDASGTRFVVRLPRRPRAALHAHPS